jgi:hypothetical protein
MREKRPRPMRMANCHPDRPHEARGMCNPCYVKWHRTERDKPSECHPDRPAVVRGMCNPCYQHSLLTPGARQAKVERERARRSSWTSEQRESESRRLTGLRNNSRQNRWRRIGCTNPPQDRPENQPCEICGQSKPLHLDHDHATGLFRGWLCGPCNQGLGQFRDDPMRIQSALNYLQRAR